MFDEALFYDLLDLLLGIGFTLEVRMFEEFLDSEPILGSVRKHLGNQIYKVFVVKIHFTRFVVRVKLPELSRIFQESFVVSVLFRSLNPRWLLRSHHEEDDCGSKQVDLFTIVLTDVHNLRGHVALCSNHGGQCGLSLLVASTFKAGGISEISKLQLVVSTQKNVGGFQISVTELVRMDILKSLQKLFEIVSAKLVLEASSLGYEVE